MEHFIFSLSEDQIIYFEAKKGLKTISINEQVKLIILGD
jgi:hypothetical protein